MTEQLEGRALDEAVASALGWKRHTHKPDGRRCIFWTVGVRVGEFLETRQHSNAPRFSEDPATLPEMLAWITSRDMCVRITVDAMNGCHADAAPLWLSPIDPALCVCGPTITAALSRLVVAVAKARGGGA
jgi:hypothetical protein